MNLENEIVDMCKELDINELLKLLNQFEQLKEQLSD